MRRRWVELMGDEPRGLFVIVDDQVGKPRGQLRALALLTELGITHVTYNKAWHTDLRPVPFMYHKLAPGRAEVILAENGHLAQIISQETLDLSAFSFTAELIRLAMRPVQARPLVVIVCDRQKLVLPGNIDGKSIFEENSRVAQEVIPLSYRTLYRRYLRSTASPIRQNLTENPYFHRLAGELRRAGWNRFDRLSDLFALNADGFPLTPMVRALAEYFLADPDRREALEYSQGPPFIQAEMRGWLERGEAGAVAAALWFGFSVYDFSLEKLLRCKGECL